MAKNLYVGNLSYTISDDELNQLFAQYGRVESARVIMDRDSGRSKGFGFVEMTDDNEAQAAIDALNGKENGGRVINVNEAKPRTENNDRGGFGGGRPRGGDRGDRGGKRF